MSTSYDTQAMEPGLGPNQSTTTTTSLPVPTNAEHILVEPRVVPANFPAATKPPPGKTNADVDDPEEDDEDAPLSPRVKLTGYRLLNILVIFTIGLAKFILSLKGRSITPTVLEWAGGSVLTILLYWIGLYEAVEPPMWEWFFHVNWAPAINFFSKCFLGGALLFLFYLWEFLPIVLVYTIYVIAFFAIFSDPSFWSFLGITYVIIFLGVLLLQAVPTKWLVWHHIPVWAPVRRFFRRYGSERGSQYRKRISVPTKWLPVVWQHIPVWAPGPVRRFFRRYSRATRRDSQYQLIGHAGFILGFVIGFSFMVTVFAVIVSLNIAGRPVFENLG